MNSLIYDIETIALSEARLALVEPTHEAPGNFKDPIKIAEAIAEKAKVWREKAALSPITGRVAMVGTMTYGSDPAIYRLSFNCHSHDDSDESLDVLERRILILWWRDARHALLNGKLLVSWNGHGFDIPFLIKRSWALNLAMPVEIDLRNKWGMQAPWIDLMREWQCGDKGAGFTSLNTAAGFLGLGQKAGDCLQLRHQLEHEPETAVAYLKQDLVLTAGVGRRMGIVTE